MAVSLFDGLDSTPLRRNDHATLLKKSLKKLPLQNVVFQLLTACRFKAFKRLRRFTAKPGQ
jgi:hypothetical protein